MPSGHFAAKQIRWWNSSGYTLGSYSSVALIITGCFLPTGSSGAAHHHLLEAENDTAATTYDWESG